MALYTDGSISNLSDLRDQETGILDTAHAEGVDLTTKLRLAQEEIGVEVVAFLLEHGPGVSSEESLRRLSNVVITPALKQWHTFHTLELAYRDLYYNQYNDRYAEKWKEYGRLARAVAALLFDTGVGIASEPVGRAAAPALSWTPGGPEGAPTAGTYYVRVCWVTATGTEGGASEAAALVASEVSQLVVTPPAAPGGGPEGAPVAGWNVFVGGPEGGPEGTPADETALQNDAPLALDSTWTMPVTGLRAGRRPSNGQSPDLYVKVSRTFRRG
ncbi:MAG: hypothetical protein NT090_27465 [Acidobacteria bacterium]|nr:hypothetical protein [Acidobacteriota bacterium]